MFGQMSFGDGNRRKCWRFHQRFQRRDVDLYGFPFKIHFIFDYIFSTHKGSERVCSDRPSSICGVARMMSTCKCAQTFVHRFSWRLLHPANKNGSWFSSIAVDEIRFALKPGQNYFMSCRSNIEFDHRSRNLSRHSTSKTDLHRKPISICNLQWTHIKFTQFRLQFVIEIFANP